MILIMVIIIFDIGSVKYVVRFSIFDDCFRMQYRSVIPKWIFG
jgi:hypothetical protein